MTTFLEGLNEKVSSYQKEIVVKRGQTTVLW